ncbi:MAG: septum formation initiator family protein [Alistipes sp.]|nr:septum formation initiator family protein [Alistipes sp.]
MGKKRSRERDIEEVIINTVDTGKRYAWVITLVAAIVLGIILIGRPLISLIRTSAEIKELNKEKALYEASIRRDSLLIENLKNDEFLEQFAREKYFMQAKGEQVFIVED